jgi:hypothetical protein
MGIEIRSAGDARGGRPESANILDPDWCGMPWTPWVPLERKAIQQTAPHAAGIIGSGDREMWSLG